MRWLRQRERNRARQKHSMQPEPNRAVRGLPPRVRGASAIRLRPTAPKTPSASAAMLAGFFGFREQMAARRRLAASGANDRGGEFAVIRFAGPHPQAGSPIRRSALRRDRSQLRRRHAAPAADADERRRAGAGHRRVPETAAVERIRRDPRPPARPPPLRFEFRLLRFRQEHETRIARGR